MWDCHTCGCRSHLHLPRPEQGHTGDAEFPSRGSVCSPPAGVKGSGERLCAAPQLSLFGFSPAVGGVHLLCCQTQSNCLAGLIYWVRGRWCVPVALRLDTQPCPPHGNSVLGLSLCPWHCCSCGDPQPGGRLHDSMKPKFGKPHGLAVVQGDWTPWALCVEQADCAGNKGLTHNPILQE